MKIAIISDIHGNSEAFREVAADWGRAGIDTAVSLGDNVGYGPDPDEVVQQIRSMKIPSVMGNHELGIARPEYLTWFNESARKSLLLTEQLISPETKDWITQLPSTLVLEDCLLVHGCPPDSITDYLFEARGRQLIRIFEKMKQHLCFVGHTHTLELVSFRDGRADRSDIGQETIRLDEGTKYIINAGSVGQPRDGDNCAKYLIWDSLEKSVEVRFVPYDIAVTSEKIIRLGFPRINATRLW